MNTPQLDSNSPSIEAVDTAMRTVATYLPFPVTLEADMGGTFALHLDLGTRGNDDDPSDTVSIDPDDAAREWYFDVEGGLQTVASGLDITARPERVARWIVEQACQFNSPAIRVPAE